jgi:hypothetical protein
VTEGYVTACRHAAPAEAGDERGGDVDVGKGTWAWKGMWAWGETWVREEGAPGGSRDRVTPVRVAFRYVPMWP